MVDSPVPCVLTKEQRSSGAYGNQSNHHQMLITISEICDYTDIWHDQIQTPRSPYNWNYFSTHHRCSVISLPALSCGLCHTVSKLPWILNHTFSSIPVKTHHSHQLCGLVCLFLSTSMYLPSLLIFLKPTGIHQKTKLKSCSPCEWTPP